jgi:hypothetical protein
MPLQISDSVIWQDTDGGISLYHTETGSFLSLNETAAEIWQLIAAGSGRDAVVARLSLRFAGTHAVLGGVIRADVDEFIDAMLSGGLLAEGAPVAP